MGVNCCTFIGNLGKDPVYKEELKLATFPIAVSSWGKDQETGQYKENTFFIDVAVWGAQAQAAAKYLQKGRKVAVVGELRESKYVKDEQWHKSYRVVANALEFLPSGKVGYVAEEDNHFARDTEIQRKDKEVPDDPVFEEVDETDLPF